MNESKVNKEYIDNILQFIYIGYPASDKRWLLETDAFNKTCSASIDNVCTGESITIRKSVMGKVFTVELKLRTNEDEPKDGALIYILSFKCIKKGLFRKRNWTNSVYDEVNVFVDNIKTWQEKHKIDSQEEVKKLALEAMNKRINNFEDNSKKEINNG